MPISRQDFTKVVHAGVRPEPVTGAIMTPIFQTSTFVQKEPGIHAGWDYSRAGNPTRDALEEAYAAIEGAKYGLAFASGLAAEQAVIQALVEAGDRVLVCDDVYGGTGRLFRRIWSKYGIDFVFADLSKLSEAEAAVRDKKPKLIWVETPTNPTMKVIDIRAWAKRAKHWGATLVVDNTFASPVFQKPLQLGADIVVHSTTKYIGGHSDIIGGAVMLSDDAMQDKIKFIQFAAGSVPSPFESFLLLRSLKTLAVRMRQHEENAKAVAEFLRGHKNVARVFFPGLKDHPGHDIAAAQMSGHSGMLSFEMRGSYDDVVHFVKALKVFALAESLGGVESLVNHPEKMTHASVPEDLRRKLGIGPNLLRLSIGIEDAFDLVADLDQALR